MRIGAYFVTPLHEGSIVVDGGVAFGAVPKRDWSKLAPADPQNGVLLGVTFYLLRGHGLNILVDTGIGRKRSPQQELALGFHRAASLTTMLAQEGLSPADIDIVVLTHLHMASAGGLTLINDENVLEPTFSKARVVIQRQEWEHGIHTNLRTRTLYAKEDFETLLWYQRLELIDGDMQLLPGLYVSVTGGHTKTHQIIVIDSEGEGAVFWGDLIPSTHHLQLNAISAMDLYPLQSLEMKAEWLTKVVANGWISFFMRDPGVAAAQITSADQPRGNFQLEPLLTHA